MLTPFKKCITNDTASSSRNMQLNTPMRKTKSVKPGNDYGDLSMQSSFHRNSVRIGPAKRAYGLDSSNSRPTSAASSQPRMSASAAKLSQKSIAIADHTVYSDQVS